MKNSLKTCLVLAGALVSTGCGPIFFAELDEPSICKTVADVPFEPAVPGADYTLTFEVPVGKYIPIFNTEDAKTTIYLNEITFTAKRNVQDFNSVDTATISVLPPAGSSLRKMVVLSYTKSPGSPPGQVLTVGGERDVDLIPYLSSDTEKSAEVEGVLRGGLPSTVWTADVRVCFHTKARFNYARQWGL